MNSEEIMARPLPTDVEAERAVLGSIMLDADVYAEVAQVLSDGPDEFSVEAHRLIFDTLRRLATSGRPVDGMLVRDELQRVQHWESAGGYERLGQCVSAVGSAHRAAHYASLVHAAHLRRLAIGACYRAAGEAFDTTRTADEAMLRVERTVLEATSKRVTERPVMLADVLAEVFAQMADGRGTGIATGLYSLDWLIDGLRPGEVTAFAARPRIGKTALALSIADNVLSAGRKVGFFSLEMSREQLLARMVSMCAAVPLRRWRKGMIEAKEREWLDAQKQRIAAMPFWVSDRAGQRIGDLIATTHVWQRKQGLDLVIIDFLQLVRVDDLRSRDQRYQQIGEVCRGLKSLAKDANIPVIALAQLGRAVEAEDRRPRLSDLRESGDIEQVMDNVVMIAPMDGTGFDANGPAEVPVEAPVDLIVAKQRQGPPGVARVSFIPEIMRFGNPGTNWTGETPPPPDGMLYGGAGGESAQGEDRER